MIKTATHVHAEEGERQGDMGGQNRLLGSLAGAGVEATRLTWFEGSWSCATRGHPYPPSTASSETGRSERRERERKGSDGKAREQEGDSGGLTMRCNGEAVMNETTRNMARSFQLGIWARMMPPNHEKKPIRHEISKAHLETRRGEVSRVNTQRKDDMVY